MQHRSTYVIRDEPATRDETFLSAQYRRIELFIIILTAQCTYTNIKTIPRCPEVQSFETRQSHRSVSLFTGLEGIDGRRGTQFGRLEEWVLEGM